MRRAFCRLRMFEKAAFDQAAQKYIGLNPECRSSNGSSAGGRICRRVSGSAALQNLHRSDAFDGVAAARCVDHKPGPVHGRRWRALLGDVVAHFGRRSCREDVGVQEVVAELAGEGRIFWLGR